MTEGFSDEEVDKMQLLMHIEMGQNYYLEGGLRFPLSGIEEDQICTLGLKSQVGISGIRAG